jgi:hypothetical protein
MTMLSRTPVVSSPASSSKRRRERLCRAKKATSSKPNASTFSKTPVPETKKTDVMMMSGKTQRRRDVFAVGVLFLSLGGASSSKESAFAYGTGGWKDCEPICDSLKGGFAAQQKLQEEMMRQSMGGGGDDTGAEAKEESKGKKAAVSEREKRKKNLR